MFHAIYIRFYKDDDWRYYTGVNDEKYALYRAHSIIGSYRGQFSEAEVAVKEVEKAIDAKSRVPSKELQSLPVLVIARKRRAKVALEEAG